MKTGRNDDCPCGSGKKYKKCCLGKDAAAVGTPAAAPLPQRSRDGRIAGLDVHPYAIARMVADPAAMARASLSLDDRAALKARWSIKKLANMETREVIERLARLGIDGSATAFRPLTSGRTSAWTIGSDWLRQIPPNRENDDFVCLAACELWKRHCPDMPSLEMLDDWVAEGYDLAEDGKQAEAVNVWFRVWDVVRPRLTPSMSTFDAVEDRFMVTQFFGNWIQDFVMAVYDAANHDAARALQGAALIRQVLAQFTQEDAQTLQMYRGDCGRLLFMAGRRADGEAELLALIRDFPHRACGYVVLSDSLARGTPADRARSVALLEQALAVPVEDAEDWDIAARLAAARPAAGTA